MNVVRRVEATQEYISKFSVVEDFDLERFQTMDKGNRGVVPGPAHSHPDPELFMPYSGYCVRVSYVENGEINTILSAPGEGIEVAGNVPHRVFLLGPTKIYTTEENLGEGERNRRNSLFDFLEKIEET